jgi:hypothetical protein
MLTRQRASDEEQEFERCFDARTGVILPGITHIKVPMRMIDSAGDLRPRDRAPSTPLNKPGFVTRDATARDSRNALYDQYDQIARDAFKNPVSNSSQTGIGSHGFTGGQVGDRCTVRRGGGGGRFLGIEGSDGRLRLIAGQLECVADDHVTAEVAAEPFRPAAPEIYDPVKGAVRRHGDAADHAATMERLYSERDRETSNAWRS